MRRKVQRLQMECMSSRIKALVISVRGQKAIIGCRLHLGPDNPNPRVHTYTFSHPLVLLLQSMPPPKFPTPNLALASLRGPRSCLPISTSRWSSASAIPNDPANATITATLPSRWLSDLKRRIGYCISFGLSPEQINEAGNISKVVAQDWRELVAGSEGFLTGRGRAGFEGRDVVWGEMVSQTGEKLSHWVGDGKIEDVERSVDMVIGCE